MTKLNIYYFSVHQLVLETGFYYIPNWSWTGCVAEDDLALLILLTPPPPTLASSGIKDVSLHTCVCSTGGGTQGLGHVR